MVPHFLVAAAAVAVLLGLELILRAVGYSSPGWYRPDPRLGWALRPGVSGWFTGEGKAFVQINSAGQRDREHRIDKPGNVYRIAVLGDAFSEGMQVALEETYWALLPELLASCGFQPGKRVEVLNFGVRGHGTAQAYLMLETTALRYRPDLVLLQFSNANDVRDNSYALDPKRDERPFFVLDEQRRLRLDDSFASAGAYASRASPGGEVLRKLAERLRVLQLARGLRNLDVMERAHAQNAGNEKGLETEALAAPRDALWKEAWRITEGLIAKTSELALRNGARLAVVTVPFAMQVHPDAAQREALQVKYGVADLAYPERRVASFARQNGVLAIMLGPQMQALAAATGSSLYGFENAKPGFGHWNDLGHRTAASIIAQQLCAQLGQ
jgi:hypothetical protein